MSACAVIIVTHNSQVYLPRCMELLQAQSKKPDAIVIVDSGSKDTSYLSPFQNIEGVQVYVTKENIGFCQGNNLGMSRLPEVIDYVLFLNPDAFLTPNFLEEAINYLDQPCSAHVGALSGLLLGYNMVQRQPTGKIDSAGIFQTWYGKWYDRAQSKDNDGQYTQVEEVPALCGALFLSRKKALDTIMLGAYEVMDPSFYMYKEDIDLSLRLRRKGWKLIFDPHLVAYHCRGWKTDRSQVPRSLRLLSARNEIRLHKRLRSPYLFYSIFKYCGVKVLNL